MILPKDGDRGLTRWTLTRTCGLILPSTEALDLRTGVTGTGIGILSKRAGNLGSIAHTPSCRLAVGLAGSTLIWDTQTRVGILMLTGDAGTTGTYAVALVVEGLH